MPQLRNLGHPRHRLEDALNYALLLECYLSGQIAERIWQEHLRDEVFRAWLKRQK